MPIDERFAEFGPKHQDTLGDIAANLEAEKLDEEKLFSTETENELEIYTQEHKREMVVELEQIIGSLRNLESTKSPGHEFAHLVDCLTSTLRIFKEYAQGENQPLSDHEKLEVILTNLGHDLGRYSELKFDRLKDSTLEYLTPAIIGREFARRGVKHVPEELFLRTIYDIASASEKYTGYRTADIVHQCDREQIVGTAVCARGLVFDLLLQSDTTIFTPADILRRDYTQRLPVPEKMQPREWLMEAAFMIRNVYDPVSPAGAEITRRNKREQAVIMMLAYQGQDEALDIIFSRERGTVTPEGGEWHWSMKPLPDGAYDQARAEAADFIESIGEAQPTRADIIETAKELCRTNAISMPDNFDTELTQRLSQVDEDGLKRFWSVLRYTLVTRNQQRQADLEYLDNYNPAPDSFESVIIGEVRKNLEDREQS